MIIIVNTQHATSNISNECVIIISSSIWEQLQETQTRRVAALCCDISRAIPSRV